MKKYMLLVVAILALVIWRSVDAVPPYYTGYKGERGAIAVNFGLEAARGTIDGISTVNKFGRNIEIDSTDTADIWDGGQVTSQVSALWVAPTAARAHTVKSSDATDVAFASVLTLDAVVGDGESVTIGTKVYTFETTLTEVDGNVLIGISAETSIENLVSAVMLTGTAGTDYALAMTANAAGISAIKTAADVCTVYSQALIATTEALLGGTNSWDAATTTAGTGAHTLRVYGLQTWDKKEVSEDIYLTGVDPVTLTNTYVIIHRMKVLTKGGTAVNAGNIDATAASDATITARIRIGQGQTQMAVYGVPSGQTAYMVSLYGVTNIAQATGAIDLALLVNPDPADDELMFLVKHTSGMQTTGSSHIDHHYNMPKAIPGPCIIKMQAYSGANDMDVSAGFDLYLVDN